jgi:hypothetical protein
MRFKLPFSVSAALAVALMLFAFGWWCRSGACYDRISFDVIKSNHVVGCFHLSSANGTLQVSFSQYSLFPGVSSGLLRWTTFPHGNGVNMPPYYVDSLVGGIGIGRVSPCQETIVIVNGSITRWEGPRSSTLKSLNLPGVEYYFVIRFYFIAGIDSLLFGVIVAKYVRERQSRAVGFCLKCGYDLRATPDQCPECGQRREAMKRGE